MKKFFLNNWPWIILVLLSGLIVWPLFVPGYFSHHDDLQVMRIFEMRKCFADGQLPCRWVPDMGYGNGYPLFNFYGVFAYYLGAIFSYAVGYIGAAKILFFIPLFFGGIGMYLLAKEIFGKVPGFVAGVLYFFAPYRALDSFVRGAVAELFAMTAVPFLLFFLLKFIKEAKIKYFLWSAIFFAIFLLSHNIMTLIFSPVVLLFALYFLFENKWKNWKNVALIFAIGIGLSAFFVLPAYFEKNMVQTDALVRAELDFRAQFVKVGQLFLDRSWNYAGSNPDQTGTISYQIGWPLWWIVALTIPILVFARRRKNIPLFALLLSIFALSVFMTHNKSAPIWEFFKILAYVQFPWRFLSIAIFSASLIGAYFVSYFSGKKLWLLAALVSITAVLLNWQYFRPEHFYYNLTDSEKLSGQNWVDQEKGSVLDYLPKTALEPREPPPASPLIISGRAATSNFVNKSNRWSFNVDVAQNAKLDVPVYDFPVWTVFVDGKTSPHSISFPTGRIEIQISQGLHSVSGEFGNTKVRTYANLISLGSFLALIYYLSRRTLNV